MAFGRSKRKYAPKHEISWLIVGLGNPGLEYEQTPHNIGFRVVEKLAESLNVRPAWVAKHDGLMSVVQHKDTDAHICILKPLTFMNLSGRSVKPALKSFNLGVDKLLVVHDEIDLPFGRLMLKQGGGLAGHNGLRSISDMLGNRDFLRLRVGVGRPNADDRRPIRDWILSPWQQTPQEVDTLVMESVEAIELVLTSGIRKAMNTVN